MKEIKYHGPTNEKRPSNDNLLLYGTHGSGRRTFATLAKEYTNDLPLVSKMLGHNDTKTTLRYIGETESDYSKIDRLFSD